MSGTTTHRARRTVPQRLLIACNICAVVGFLAAAAGLGYGYDKYGQIPRVEISEHLSGSVEVDDGDVAENYLVVGVDSAEGLDPDDPIRSTRSGIDGLRSDTMMIVRVDPASTRAALLSIPRDLYVPIAGTDDDDRINDALQTGGPQALIETIQDYFGIPIHHYAQVDFYGFTRLVDAVDGVPIFFEHPTRDQRSGLDVPDAGCITLDPAQALGYVRSRAYQEYVDGRWRTDPTGDLGRIERQQEFIVQAMERAFDRGVRNPVTLDEMIDSALAALVVDDTITGDDLLRLGRQFRRFDPDSLDIYELPVFDDTVGGAAILRLQTREASSVLDIFRDRDPAVVSESSVRVRVLNGSGVPGEASAAAEELRDAGFAIAGTGDASDLGIPDTEVLHPPGEEASADLVSRWLIGGAELVEDPDVDDVTLVTGLDYAGLRAQPEPAPPTSSTTLPRITTTVPETTTESTTVDPDDPGSDEEVTEPSCP